MHFVKILNLFKLGRKCLCFLKKKIIARTCFLKTSKTVNVATDLLGRALIQHFFVIAILKKKNFLRSESNIKLTYNTNKIKKETTLQLVSSIRG